MAKYRIVKLPQYYTLYNLEKKGYLGWSKVELEGFNGCGSLTECQNVLKFFKEHSDTDGALVVHKEEF